MITALELPGKGLDSLKFSFLSCSLWKTFCLFVFKQFLKQTHVALLWPAGNPGGNKARRAVLRSGRPARGSSRQSAAGGGFPLSFVVVIDGRDFITFI